MEKPDFSGYRKFNSWYDSAIIWNQHGYWCEKSCFPNWYNADFVREAQDFAKGLVEPETELWYETHANGENYGGKCAGGNWITYDKANKIIYFENAVGGCACEKGAESYIKNRHSEHKALYDGVIRALLVYKNTGIACLPDWNTNKSDTYGWQGDKMNKVPRAREVQAMA